MIGLPRKRVTLVVRNAGFGDMLSQVNLFFHLSDIFNFKPQIYLKPKNARNSLCHKEFFRQIGLNKVITGSRPTKLTSLSDIHHPLEKAYQFDMACYSDDKLKSIAGMNVKRIHPGLIKLGKKSFVYKQLEDKPLKRIAVHVRRGDVCQIIPENFQNIFRTMSTKRSILHCSGLVEQKNLNNEIAAGNLNRFYTEQSYLIKLNELKAQFNIDTHIVISDGYTKLAKAIIKENRQILIEPSISEEQLETLLAEEIANLSRMADFAFIGENDGFFYKTIYAALSSEIIISSSPGFLRNLAGLFELPIKFVKPGHLTD